MAHKHFTLFNPESNYDFVGRRNVFYAVTGVGILASIVALSTLGFNKGIDFKGGTKQIVAFEPSAAVDRLGLKESVEGILHSALGAGKESVGDVEVQEFDTGSGGGAGKKHFAVVTEVTSMLTPTKREAIAKALKAQFGEKIDVEWAQEGEDRVFVTLPESKKITDTYASLSKIFADAGFAKTKASCDLEVQLDVNLFRSLQMLDSESGAKGAEATEADKKTAEGKIAAEETKLRAAKEAELADKSDARFTVVIEEFKSKLEDGIRAKYGKAFLGVESSTAVSPSVAGEMMNQGLVSIIYALLGIVLYILLRFDVRYAPGALIATAHDVVLVIGAFSVAQVKFSMPVIAAVLTVAGYSVTDTIVVFDRIRETQEKHPGVKIETIINSAINQTMSRTVLTSLTTFMTSASIFFFGGGLIRDFAFAMCTGVIVGTFSSICVAAPIFLWLHHRLEDRKVRLPDHSAAVAS